MKTATVGDLKNNFEQVESWLGEGEHIALMKNGKVIGRIVPTENSKEANGISHISTPSPNVTQGSSSEPHFRARLAARDPDGGWTGKPFADQISEDRG